MNADVKIRTYAEGLKVAERLWATRDELELPLNVKCKQTLVRIWINPKENPRGDD